MEVSSPAAKRIPVYREICCDACGYPRTGLTDGSLCPECGGTPSVIDAPPRSPAMTLGARAWMRRLSAGLILLVISYISALQVILVMPTGPYMFPATNVIAPKIAATALIQRTLGGKAAAPGVSGVIAVLGSVLAIWIITHPRHSDTRSEDLLRGLLRWTAVITVGAGFGLSLAWNRVGTASDTMKKMMLLLLGVCELPVNTLLYAYLRRVADSLAQPRAAQALALCSWTMPILIVVSGCLVPFIDTGNDEAMWLLGPVSSVLGALCLICGMLAIGAIARLILTTTSAALRGWIKQGERAFLRMFAAIKMLFTSIQRDSARWSVVFGILLWLCTIPYTASEALWYGARYSTGGDMPYINYLAPKIFLGGVTLGRWIEYYPYSGEHDGLFPVLVQALAIWMLTRPAGQTGLELWLRIATRAVTALTTGAALGWSLWLPQRWNSDYLALHRAQVLIVVTLFGEMPATVLSYWHIAAMARRFSLPDLCRRLRWLAIISGFLIVLPLGFFYLASLRTVPHKSAIAISSAMLIMAIEISVGLTALTAMAELAWRLATNSHRRRDQRLSSATHDPSLAHANAV